MSLCKSRLWTIGSGSGGVGKSFLTASMGAALARAGKSVIVVDAHLAAPNLHAHLGIKSPAITLLDVVEKRAALSDALMPTKEPKMSFLSCVGDELGMADRNPRELQTIAERLSSLEADYVLIDTGSGTSSSVLDFFNLGDEPIVVATPDQTSMQCAYGFVRNAIYHRVQKRFGAHGAVGPALLQMRQGACVTKPRTMIDFCDLLRPAAPDLAERVAAMVDAYKPLLLVNMAASEQDQRLAEIIQSVARKFLNVDMRSCGLVQFDKSVRRAPQRVSLLDGSETDSSSARQIRQMALDLAGIVPSLAGAERVGPQGSAAIAMITGLNDNLAFMGRDLHIQTEDMGNAGHCITTQVFCDGRVILSTKSDYPSTLQELRQTSQIVELMRTQHFNVIREIENRRLRFESAQA